MKKIILLIICFFSSILIVNANTLVSEPLPYYVLLKRGSVEKIINIKKIYDKDSNDVVFNVDYNNYEIGKKFEKYSEYNNSTWKLPKSLMNLFNNIVYYGYNSKPSDLNYFLTQIIIWNLMLNVNVDIVDESGNKITNYDSRFYEIFNTSINHNSQALFFTQEHESELWSKKTFAYNTSNQILDNPIIDAFEFTNYKEYLTIYAKDVGNYNLEFTKDYEQENYCYSDGVNTYWQNLKGPQDLLFILKYYVKGINFNIKENLIGVNNRYGDAKLNSKYELYLDNELKFIINDLKNINIKNDSNYLLRDISDSKGVLNVDDIYFDVQDDEYTLIIDKYVVSKNISLSITSSKNYNIYLKSNNELYETVNSSINLITLPYGKYYIKDEDNTYYKELDVLDNIDEELVIEDNIEEDEITQEESSTIIVPIVENPQTYDNIYVYLIAFICSLIMIIILKIMLVKNI